VDKRHMQLSWHRSSRCSSGGCVEMASTVETVLVRDSKLRDSAILSFEPAAWNAFVTAAVAGEIRPL
jgi:hypothetical protein